MSVSNKTLSILLLAAIVVSLGGTFISLNRLGTLPSTGYTTSNDTGTVQLDLEDLIMITTEDSPLINFGACTLLEGGLGILINSENNTAHAGQCVGGNLPSYISVRNEGTVPVIVQFELDKVGEAQGGNFLNNQSAGTDQSWISYRFLDQGDGSYTGGCSGTLGAGTYTNVSAANTLYSACTILDSDTTANSLLAHFQIYVPDDTQSGDTVEVKFVAAKA